MDPIEVIVTILDFDNAPIAGAWVELTDTEELLDDQPLLTEEFAFTGADGTVAIPVPADTFPDGIVVHVSTAWGIEVFAAPLGSGTSGSGVMSGGLQDPVINLDRALFTLGPDDGYLLDDLPIYHNTQVRPYGDNETCWSDLNGWIDVAANTAPVEITQLVWESPFYTSFSSTIPDPPGTATVSGVQLEPLLIGKAKPPKSKTNLRILLNYPLIDESHPVTQIDYAKWQFRIEIVKAALLYHARRAMFAQSKKRLDKQKPTSAALRGFEFYLNHGWVMHAKMVLAGDTAFMVASPFQQSYFDGPEHRIADGRRGGAAGLPTHEVSVALKGDVVDKELRAHFYECWNHHTVEGKPPAEQREAPVAGPAQTWPKASVQIARSLPGKRFTDAPRGRDMILHAYLTAIHNAKHFIYLENQYFQEAAIAQALARALKDKPNLHVIMLLNSDNDQFWYIRSQNALIQEIRDYCGPSVDQRFAVMMRWSDALKDGKRQVIPNYVHAKLGIIDDVWLTIGSANLDGASLSTSLYEELVYPWDPDRTQRAVEVNAVISTAADLPAADPDLAVAALARRGGRGRAMPRRTGVARSALPSSTFSIADLRRTLWAEHLGYAPTDAKLDQTTAKLWKDRSAEKVKALKDNTDHPCHVLHAYEVRRRWYNKSTNFEKQLKNILGGLPRHLQVLTEVPRFDLVKGKWK